MRRLNRRSDRSSRGSSGQLEPDTHPGPGRANRAVPGPGGRGKPGRNQAGRPPPADTGAPPPASSSPRDGAGPGGGEGGAGGRRRARRLQLPAGTAPRPGARRRAPPLPLPERPPGSRDRRAANRVWRWVFLSAPSPSPQRFCDQIDLRWRRWNR